VYGVFARGRTVSVRVSRNGFDVFLFGLVETFVLSASDSLNHVHCFLILSAQGEAACLPDHSDASDMASSASMVSSNVIKMMNKIALRSCL
jgi:hypothetical protein